MRLASLENWETQLCYSSEIQKQKSIRVVTVSFELKYIRLCILINEVTFSDPGYIDELMNASKSCSKSFSECQWECPCQ